MARTPSLRALEQVAREHREAARRGIAVEAVREEVYTRREILRRGGAVGAGLALGGLLLSARPARAAARARVAIVGGGIAGLTAALTLQDKGLASTVYEAADRLGGRMHSDRSGYWDDGQVSEFCGELIDTGHRTIRKLAKRFGLQTVDLLAAEPRRSDDTYFFDGAYYDPDQVAADYATVYPALQQDANDAGYPTTYQLSTPAGVALDNMSVYHWIESRVPGGHSSRFGQLLDAAYAAEYGAETRVQSALNLVYLLSGAPSPGDFAVFGASDERFHIVGGNELLPEAIAATLPQVRTGWRLVAIKANGDGSVNLTFDAPGGSRAVTADHAILCVPFSILRNVDYSRAGFDALKRKAITQLGVGRNAKLQLQFTSRYWNTHGPWGLSTGGVFTDLKIQNGWDVTRGQGGTSGIVVDYTGGDLAGYTPAAPYSTAADDPKVATYAQQFLDRLDKVWPGIARRWNGKATLSAPVRDENLRCSYSYWKVGQYHSFSGYEGVPQGAIHFAGEHCSQDFQGFMEGGATEGIRAAKEVLAAL